MSMGKKRVTINSTACKVHKFLIPLFLRSYIKILSNSFTMNGQPDTVQWVYLHSLASPSDTYVPTLLVPLTNQMTFGGHKNYPIGLIMPTPRTRRVSSWLIVNLFQCWPPSSSSFPFAHCRAGSGTTA